MGLFKKNTKNENMTEGQKLAARYNGARNNIMLVLAFTLVNSVLLFIGSDSYFLFSAAIPYYMTMFGLLYTGRMPAEYYEGVEGFVPDPDVVLYIYLAIAVAILAVYLLTWYLSKKHGYGWLVAALVLFVADTAAMFYLTDFSEDMILDVVFHGWVIISLTSGIFAALKLKKLPPEKPVVPQQTYGYAPQTEMPVENNQAYASVEENTEEVQQ